MQKLLLLTLISPLLLALQPVKALELDYLEGQWLIKSKESVQFHVGHSHLPKDFKKLAIINFCTDGDQLYGRIKQRFLELPRKLVVSDVIDNTSNQLLVAVTPKKNRIESAPLEIDLLVDRNESSEETEVLISFDGGSNYYTMEKKRSRISRACRKEIRKARTQ